MLGEYIAGGRTSTVYRFGADSVAKILTATTPPDWAEAEASFTASVHELGVPAPEVRDLIEVDGRPAIIFEYVEGASMWSHMLSSPSEVRSLVRDLVGVQRAIHQAGVPDGLPSMAERLAQKIEGAGELDRLTRRKAVAQLGDMPAGAALLHGDLHPGNVLISPKGLKVIDWFDASVGHPAADVARSVLLLRGSGATDLRHLPGADASFAQLVHDEYLAELGDLGCGEDHDSWIRFAAAGRLAERTDLDVTGLLELCDVGSDRQPAEP